MRLLEASLTGRRWGIYARLSMDREGSGLGVERQIAEDTEMIKAIDPTGEIVEIYVDNDMSASKKKKRPDYERMIRDTESGHINALSVWHIDRLTRRNDELERIVDLIERTRAVFKCVHGDVDLSTPIGRMVARILGAVAQGEVEHKGTRQKSANRQRAQQGKAWHGGLRRYGYDTDGVSLRPDEVEVVRHMVDHMLKGGSLRGLVKWLNDNGHRTTQGNLWTARSVSRLLKNPAMSGHRTYLEAGRPESEREIVKRNAWPAIISDEERESIRVILVDPSRTTNTVGENRRKYLLTGGILRCGLCGTWLSAHKTVSGKPGYVCRKAAPYHGCERIRIAAEGLELDVAAQVLARFASPGIRRRLIEAASPAGDLTLAEELAQVQTEAEQLGRDYADPSIAMPREAFLAASRALKAREDELKLKIKQSMRFDALPDVITPKALADWWASPTTSLEQRRQLILTVIDHIVVGPATRKGFRGFDRDRLAYVWR